MKFGKTLVVLITIAIALLINCGGNKNSISYYYLHQPRIEGRSKEVSIYIDEAFSEAEKDKIIGAIDQWNYVLNGYLEMKIKDLSFDMEIEDIKSGKLEGAIFILRIEPNSLLLEQNNLKLTLGFANGIGGDTLYLIPGNMTINNVYGVTLHELGHLLGSPHTATGLMRAIYSAEDYLCVDEWAVEKVAAYWEWDWKKMNYCVHKED